MRKALMVAATLAAIVGSTSFALAAFPNFTLIYRFTGARISVLAHNSGIQTVVQCTNWHTNSPAGVRVIIRNSIANASDSIDINIPSRNTVSFTTWSIMAYDTTVLSVPFLIDSGSIEVLATRPQVHCHAFVLEAGFVNPFFTLPLVGVRNNQEAGSHE
jgi:hypothetical protein